MFIHFSDARWDDLCVNVPVAMHEMLKSWQYESHTCSSDTIQVGSLISTLFYIHQQMERKSKGKELHHSDKNSFANNWYMPISILPTETL